MNNLTLSIIVSLFVTVCFSANIVENLVDQWDRFGGPDQRVSDSRTVSGTPGSNVTITYRINRYGAAGQDLPLYVFVHEWGGDLDRCESYAGTMNKQFGSVVGLMISFGSGVGGAVTGNWYWGNVSGGHSYPWAHNATIALVKDVLDGTISVSDAV